MLGQSHSHHTTPRTMPAACGQRCNGAVSRPGIAPVAVAPATSASSSAASSRTKNPPPSAGRESSSNESVRPSNAHRTTDLALAEPTAPASAAAKGCVPLAVPAEPRQLLLPRGDDGHALGLALRAQ